VPEVRAGIRERVASPSAAHPSGTTRWEARWFAVAGLGLAGAGICTTDLVFEYPTDAPLLLEQERIAGHVRDLTSLLFFVGVPDACVASCLRVGGVRAPERTRDAGHLRAGRCRVLLGVAAQGKRRGDPAPCGRQRPGPSRDAGGAPPARGLNPAPSDGQATTFRNPIAAPLSARLEAFSVVCGAGPVSGTLWTRA